MDDWSTGIWQLVSRLIENGAHDATLDQFVEARRAGDCELADRLIAREQQLTVSSLRFFQESNRLVPRFGIAPAGVELQEERTSHRCLTSCMFGRTLLSAE